MKYFAPVAAFVVALGLATSAQAASTIHVKLWDKGTPGDMTQDMHMKMGDTGDLKQAMFGIKVDHDSVKAGKVTFKVTNVSKDIVHEMIVTPVKAADATLPYVAGEYRVDEDAAGHLGEVSELEPGKSGALTLTLKPGLYALLCNVPGHFSNGMWTTITVK